MKLTLSFRPEILEPYLSGNKELTVTATREHICDEDNPRLWDDKTWAKEMARQKTQRSKENIRQFAFPPGYLLTSAFQSAPLPKIGHLACYKVNTVNGEASSPIL
jgi:hypothetical protein